MTSGYIFLSSSKSLQAVQLTKETSSLRFSI